MFLFYWHPGRLVRLDCFLRYFLRLSCTASRSLCLHLTEHGWLLSPVWLLGHRRSPETGATFFSLGKTCNGGPNYYWSLPNATNSKLFSIRNTHNVVMSVLQMLDGHLMASVVMEKIYSHSVLAKNNGTPQTCRISRVIYFIFFHLQCKLFAESVINVRVFRPLETNDALLCPVPNHKLQLGNVTNGRWTAITIWL